MKNFGIILKHLGMDFTEQERTVKVYSTFQIKTNSATTPSTWMSGKHNWKEKFSLQAMQNPVGHTRLRN